MITKDVLKAIYALNPKVVSMRVEDDGTLTAYDEKGKVVSVNLDAAKAKALEMPSEQESAKQASLDKLAALGLTPEDLKNILG